MREFILYSRTGRTDHEFRNLREGGRLDVVYQTILMSIFRSHGLRKDVVFHAILGGPPNPPLELMIEGGKLSNVRTDENTWEEILKKVLSGMEHPGISVRKNSLQHLIKEKENIFVLEESGESINSIDLGIDPVFVLGDHVGLPKKDEDFALRYGVKVSLGQKAYLAAACICIINYVLDRREVSRLD